MKFSFQVCRKEGKHFILICNVDLDKDGIRLNDQDVKKRMNDATNRFDYSVTELQWKFEGNVDKRDI